MKLPNKVISYKESVISKFPSILSVLSEGPMTLYDLYELTKDSFGDIQEYMDTLDCLYALQKVDFDDESEVINYVT